MGRNWLKLAGSIVIDLIGMGTYIIPGFSELADIVWAPLSTLMIYLMYRKVWFAGIAC